MIETLAPGRHRRRRRAATAWQALPALTRSQREVLLRWARGDAPLRRWGTLQALAGVDAIEVAEGLLGLLLEAGCVQLDEQFRAGRWWPHQVTWIDLARLQHALDLPSLAERDAAHEQTVQSLREVADSIPALRVAALALLDARLSSALLAARAELLRSLASWVAEQRSGMRQDFALHARPHTKAVTDAEWRWLDSELDLGALRIERFAPLLWLAGPMSLASALGRSSLHPWPFIGVPVEALHVLTQVDDPPVRYWVIENRASFERQARQRERDQCVLWVPGRPSGAWLEGVACLLKHAPAPARVSADADPAGIEIALTVGALWAAHGLEWKPYAMESERLAAAKTLALNDYDRDSLQRVLASEEISVELRELAQAIQRLGRKAEQEGWL